MDRNLALEAVRVTEAAALASARLMGRGDIDATDRAGAEAMLRTFRSIAINGVIVIGDARMPRAACSRWARGSGTAPVPSSTSRSTRIEGAAICATGGYNALSIVAIAERNGFLRCPDMYMEKIAVGPEARGLIKLERSPTDNLRTIAEARGIYVADLTVAILDRPRHEKLVEEVRRAGARVELLRDGDVAAAMATTRPGVGHRHADRHRRRPPGHPDRRARCAAPPATCRPAWSRATATTPSGRARWASATSPRSTTSRRWRRQRDVRRHRRHQRRLPRRRPLLPRRRRHQLGGHALAHPHRALPRARSTAST